MDLGGEASLKKYSRYLRYPGPKEGLGYRVMRAGVIAAFQVRSLVKK